ncbi:DUF1488 family protein [Ferrimonas marina]|uniref:Transcriptional regulator n=1 Tax=Ferrimonas marina TaxID=299255 RepID=A0A1M5ZH51_9GAMM|nr:DUF1488 domain-containing protein [Ferrimonas marina]SHI23550.1 Protein of unknown function [Ferrimonas marina]
MNQQILFNDQVELDWEGGWLRFNALVAGQTVGCFIALMELHKRLGQEITEREASMVAFEQLRFDLEAEAETLIEDEAYDAQGRIWLGHPAI